MVVNERSCSALPRTRSRELSLSSSFVSWLVARRESGDSQGTADDCEACGVDHDPACTHRHPQRRRPPHGHPRAQREPQRPDLC